MNFTIRLNFNQLSRSYSSIGQRLHELKQSSGAGSALLKHLQRLLPGILLCAVITVVATLLEAVEVHFAGLNPSF